MFKINIFFQKIILFFLFFILWLPLSYAEGLITGFLLGSGGNSFVNNLILNPLVLVFFFFIVILMGSFSVFKGLLRFAFQSNGQFGSRETSTISFMFAFIGTSGLFFLIGRGDGVNPAERIVEVMGGFGVFLIIVMISAYILKISFAAYNENKENNMALARIYLSGGIALASGLLYLYTTYWVSVLKDNVTWLTVFNNTTMDIFVLAFIIFVFLSILGVGSSDKEETEKGYIHNLFKKIDNEFKEINKVYGTKNKKLNDIIQTYNEGTEGIKDVEYKDETNVVNFFMNYKNINNELILRIDTINKYIKDINDFFDNEKNSGIERAGIVGVSDRNILGTGGFTNYNSKNSFLDKLPQIEDQLTNLSASLKKEINDLQNIVNQMKPDLFDEFSAFQSLIIRYNRDQNALWNQLRVLLPELITETEKYVYNINHEAIDMLKSYIGQFITLKKSILEMRRCELVLSHLKSLIAFLRRGYGSGDSRFEADFKEEFMNLFKEFNLRDLGIKREERDECLEFTKNFFTGKNGQLISSELDKLDENKFNDDKKCKEELRKILRLLFVGDPKILKLLIEKNNEKGEEKELNKV
jgi:hypothetical protein